MIIIKKDLTDGEENSILMNVEPNSISLPIEHGPHSGKGEPWAIIRHNRPLTNRQQALLDMLPEYDSRATVNKIDVSMRDLAALTAKTGVEFAMFTRGPRRLVVRGNSGTVNITFANAAALSARGYKWSGHTHVGHNLAPSHGDRGILNAFSQNKSVIYNTYGKYYTFYKK